MEPPPLDALLESESHPEAEAPLSSPPRSWRTPTRRASLRRMAYPNPRFHLEAAAAFGGGTLLELTANQLAQRLLESDIPVTQLRQNGYPEHLVQMVKRLMATQGASAK